MIQEHIMPAKDDSEKMKGMQLNRTDVRILEFLLGNLEKDSSMNGIAEGIKVSYPAVRERTILLREKGVTSIREVNPTQSLCRASVDNAGNASVFSYVEFLRKERFMAGKKELKATVEDILGGIAESSFTMILFGSHAKGKERPSSDIDILFLTDGNEDRIMDAVATAGRLTKRKIHAITMTYDDFFRPNKKGAAGLQREVLESHVIVYGAEAFYRMLATHG
jgi:predicted nucleotidyltransferase